MNAITVRNVKKSFGSYHALKGISFEVKSGECFGLLGPNGAGKSTLIGLFYDLRPRDSGGIEVFGLDPQQSSSELKKRLGVVTQDDCLDQALSVFDNLMIFCEFMGVEKSVREQRIHELLDFMALSHKAAATIKSLSGGMKRRLVFVRALLSRPDLIILDEPTTGLDPAVRHLLWEKVNELKKKGVTLILTTHYMDEAEKLCDRLAILDQGEIRAIGRPQDLIQEYCPGFVLALNEDVENYEQIFAYATTRGFKITRDVSGVNIRTNSLDEIAEARKELHLEPLLIRPANLEDVFLEITGRELTRDA